MRIFQLIPWLALVACSGKGDEPSDPPETDSDTESSVLAPDLAERLGEDEVRAGVVTDEAALFGGISAEGRVGDLKIYNDRVQFVIQGIRDGSYYITEGGHVLDADIVRADGEMGRDMVEELGPMYGLGRMMKPEVIEVVADGSDGEAAIVRVSGPEEPMGLIEGALESTSFLKNYGGQMVTEYRLEPGSWLLEVTSEYVPELEASIGMGDILLGAPEVGRTWSQYSGFGPESGKERIWTGYVGERNDVAVAMIAGPGDLTGSTGYDILTELADMSVAFRDLVDVAPGEAIQSTRYYGVGPDMATLSDAALELHGVSTEDAQATVETPWRVRGC